MRKTFFLIVSLLFLLLGMGAIPSFVYSSNPLIVECQVDGKILQNENNILLVQIYEFEVLYNKEECPVKRGDIYEIKYSLQDDETVDVLADSNFTAEVGRVWKTPEPGKSSIFLNWYSIKDEEGDIVSLVNPQSDSVPIETRIIEEDEKRKEDEEEVSSKYFDLKLERKPQSGFNKHVRYILTIYPHIDSKRTQILWNVPSSLKIKPKHNEFINLKKGETYILKADIEPTKAGVFDFSVSALAWEHDTNYTNVVSEKIEFDSNLILQPVSSEYKWINILKYVLIVLAFVGAVFGLLKLFSKLSPKIKAWLTPPPM